MHPSVDQRIWCLWRRLYEKDAQAEAAAEDERVARHHLVSRHSWAETPVGLYLVPMRLTCTPQEHSIIS